MSVSCDCCVLSGKGVCDGPIIRPEKSFRMWCIIVCVSRNLKNESALTRFALLRQKGGGGRGWWGGDVRQVGEYLQETGFFKHLLMVKE
jgi:hypothetical protein